jgi:hypothetical protein
MNDPKTLCIEGPFEIEMKVGITNDEQSGTVTFSFGHGKMPTADNVQAAIAECSKQAAAQGFRLMDRHEYMQDQLGLAGVVIPGPRKFPSSDKWGAR